ncbi:hypothetical protein C8T65DRAFT_699623 [Cerioporus squamosus]|nr:hypothetical protein C8T65DRAFT_699623 [Cerioporus squamosus]
MSDITIAEFPIATTTDNFAALCAIQDDVRNAATKLRSELSLRLDITTANDVPAWKQRFLTRLVDTNAVYRIWTLNELRTSAYRARVLDASNDLTRTADSVAELNSDIKEAIEKASHTRPLINHYEGITPLLQDHQKEHMDSESKALRARAYIIDDILETVEDKRDLLAFRLILLTQPEHHFETLIRPLTYTPPSISTRIIDPICAQLVRICEARDDVASQIDRVVATAIATWFGPAPSPSADEAATLQLAHTLRGRILSLVPQQEELMTSISLYQERAENAPAMLNVGGGQTVDVMELIATVGQYELAMEQISHFYEMLSMLLEKAMESIEKVIPAMRAGLAEEDTVKTTTGLDVM